jgi:hypothetical protein
MPLRLLKQTAASVATPATGKASIFIDSADGLPKYKDEAGTVNSLKGADGAAGSGDVDGPSSSTDNTLPRFDGTGGKTIQTSNVVVSDSDEISGYRALVEEVNTTTYTLQASDRGKVKVFNNASAITVTLPNSLSQGFAITWVQKGAGAVTFTPASGATRNNRSTHTKSAGQWAMGSLYVDSNSGGAAAAYVLGGDTAA